MSKNLKIGEEMETNIRQDNNEEVEIDIMQILMMLLSKIWILIVSGIAVAIIAFSITELAITPLYQSSIKLYIINRQNGSTTTLSDIQSSTQLVQDYKVLVTSLPVVEQVIRNLDLDMEADDLVSKIKCEIESDSRVLQVTVTDPDPERAKEIVDAVADISAKQITSVMQIEGVNVIEYGRVATSPSSPNVKKNTVLGAAVGVVLAIAVLVVKFLLDDTIKSSEDVERYLGITNLSLIPLTEEEYNGHSSSKKKKEEKVIIERLEGIIMQKINLENTQQDNYQVRESYRNLRTNIFLSGKDTKVVMFTSCGPNEGKSTVTMNLASSIADGGKKSIVY